MVASSLTVKETLLKFLLQFVMYGKTLLAGKVERAKEDDVVAAAKARASAGKEEAKVARTIVGKVAEAHRLLTRGFALRVGKEDIGQEFVPRSRTGRSSGNREEIGVVRYDSVNTSEVMMKMIRNPGRHT